MGSPFDYLDPLSHPNNHEITEKQFKNRILLRIFMTQLGFKPIKTEWWHFTLIDEPFPDKYFDFIVK